MSHIARTKRDNMREWTSKDKKLNIYEKLHLAARLYYRDIGIGWMYKPYFRRKMEHIAAKDLYRELVYN